MTTRRSHVTATTGWTVYLLVARLSDGKVFDWSDSAWKVLASATTPNVNATSIVSIGGSESLFAADVNLATINASLTAVDVVLIAFRQLAGAAAPATDTPLGEAESFAIRLGDVVRSDVPDGGVVVKTTVSVTSTAGTTARFKVQLLTAEGTLIDLDSLDPAATCAVSVVRDGDFAQFDLLTTDFGAPVASGWFEFDYANPGFADDRGYTALATVVAGGVTYSGRLKTFHVVP